MKFGPGLSLSRESAPFQMSYRQKTFREAGVASGSEAWTKFC